MNEVAIPTTTDVAVPEPAVLDLYADLVEQERFLYRTIKEWTAQHKVIEDKIRELIGDAVEAKFAGKTAYTYERIDRLNETTFKKAYPTLAEVYTETVEKRELNVDLLKRDQPEKFAEHQVRQLKRVN